MGKSGLRWTILRTTQFHDLVLRLIRSFGADDRAEVRVPAGMRFQSIDSGEVADRLIGLMEAGETGRVPDAGGPELLTIEEIAEAYLRIRGRNARVRSEPVEGAMFDVFRSGKNLTPARAVGRIGWDAFVRALAEAERP